MDPFDECILSVLKKARSVSFDQLLAETGLSHNTVRLYLHRLVDQGLVVKEKIPSKRLGRPSFAYSLSPQVNRQLISVGSSPFTETVTLNFSRLRHLCRFEKGGYCKEIKDRCVAQKCPQILKRQ
jgi:DNA-binding IclR family transcriptional regulator